MTNHWYISRDNEILIDMDKPSTSIPHAERRLFGAIKAGALDVLRVEIHDSFTPEHVHVLVTLRSPMQAIARMVWALMLHSDTYRGCSSIMRTIHGISCADLLITPHQFKRESDYLCECHSKHNAAVMDVCPVAIETRGSERLRSFFAIPMEIESGDEIISVYERNHGFKNYIWYNSEF